MSDASTTMTWVALLVGAAGAAVAGWRLRRRNPADGGRSRDLATMMFGLVVVLNTVPRLAGASSSTVLAFSSIALLPLAGFVALCVRGLRT